MKIFTLILIAAGLSTDALAISICTGMEIPRFKTKQALGLATYFAIFHLIMFLLGWLLAHTFKDLITPFSAIISFVILTFLGGNMIYEAVKEKKHKRVKQSLSLSPNPLNRHSVIYIIIAASLDAMAIGLSLAFTHTSFLLPAFVISLVTFLFALIGGLAGEKIGHVFQKRAEILGGIVLLGMGLKTLLEFLIK